MSALEIPYDLNISSIVYNKLTTLTYTIYKVVYRITKLNLGEPNRRRACVI